MGDNAKVTKTFQNNTYKARKQSMQMSQVTTHKQLSVPSNN